MSTPSGLDLLSISESLLSGPLFGGLYPLGDHRTERMGFCVYLPPGFVHRERPELYGKRSTAPFTFGKNPPKRAEPFGVKWNPWSRPLGWTWWNCNRNPPPTKSTRSVLYPLGEPERRGNERADLFSPSTKTLGLRGLKSHGPAVGGLANVDFAMGSGAALGYSIIGILKALERNGIYPDLLAGTSMGALVGSFYAAGKSVAELEEIALSITKKRLWTMADFSFPWKGVIMETGFSVSSNPFSGNVSFDQLQLPFACVATEIHSGTERVLSHGAVAEAVRASLSLPFFFEPFFWQGRYLVDGGVVNPVPTSIVQAMGADIALSVKHYHGPRGQTTSKPSQTAPIGFQPPSWPQHISGDGQDHLHHAIRDRPKRRGWGRRGDCPRFS
jgi:predicted acylesterase/phospholipase RssA